MNSTLNEGLNYLDTAYKAWAELADLRRNRSPCKDFTYGRQWGDMTKDEYDKSMTEYELSVKVGKTPATNNLIRHLVKSVVGRYRSNCISYPKSIEGVLRENCCDELDSRNMEEFLISGCCFQRVEKTDGGAVKVSNVSPAKMFLNKVKDPRGLDVEMIGQLHDMSMSEILVRLSDGSRQKAVEICKIYGAESPVYHGVGGFYCSDDVDKYRIIEVWEKESREIYNCHDKTTGELFTAEPRVAAALPDTVERYWSLQSVWRCRWITPQGYIISQYDSPTGHPFVFKMYPLTDGEVHSFIEDVIDQQKFVNRMITIIDHVLDSTAKGVLLYPVSLLPKNFSWQDLKKAWRTPNSVIPYDSMQGDPGEMPHQVVVNGSGSGAYELLNLQMGLFEKISGVTGILQGQTVSGNGAKMYESQVENAVIALSDLFQAFNSFITLRNRLVEKIIG